MTSITLSNNLRISIELATADDIDDIVALETRAYEHPWSRNVLLGEINGEKFSYVYVARAQGNSDTPGKIIGYNFFWVVADEVHILNVAVDPDYQGCGCGKQLVFFAENFGRDRGTKSMFLEVRVSNTAAQEMYKKLGFFRIGMRKKYYADGEDAYTLKKAVDGE